STGLAPEFNFVDVATPYARKFLGLDNEHIGQTLQEILNQLLDTGRTLLTLPRSVEQMITRLETGQIEVKLANISNGGGRRGRGRRRGNGNLALNGQASNGVTWLLIFGSSLAGGIYLTGIQQVAPGWFCLALAGLSALG